MDCKDIHIKGNQLFERQNFKRAELPNMEAAIENLKSDLWSKICSVLYS